MGAHVFLYCPVLFFLIYFCHIKSDEVLEAISSRPNPTEYFTVKNK